MIEPSAESMIAQTMALLNHYGFDLGGSTPEDVVARWFNHYSADWVYYAVLEALYLGRYKTVSVEQILGVWLRKGQPIYHFSHDFARLIGRKNAQEDESFLESTVEISPPQESFNPPPHQEITPGMKTNQQRIQPLAPTGDKPYFPPNLPSSKTSEETANAPQPDPKLAPPSQGITKLKRLLNQDSSTPYEPDWSRGETSPTPIDQFTPKEGGRFYRKLREIANDSEQ